MARFRCTGCGQRSASVIGCTRCGTVTGRRIQPCPLHGTLFRPACRACRARFRTPSGH